MTGFAVKLADIVLVMIIDDSAGDMTSCAGKKYVNLVNSYWDLLLHQPRLTPSTPWHYR